ncbi:hypothetical protein ACFL9T_03795 [Thermodesulfobacteriota bacterium]
MAISTEDLIKALREKGVAWIISQRQRYRNEGEPLPAGARRTLGAYVGIL